MHLRTTIQIASDITTVWKAVSDPQQWETWMTDVKRVTPKQPGTPARYGSEYTVSQAWWKFDDQTIQIREVEEPQRVVFAASTSAGEFTFEYLLTELPDRRVSVESILSDGDLASRVSGFLDGGSMERQLVAEAAQLRDHCESISPQDVVRG